MTLDSILSFGKYKGHLLSDVIQLNPKYVNWLVFKNMITIDGRSSVYLEKCLNAKIKQFKLLLKQKYRRIIWDLYDGLDWDDVGDYGQQEY